MGTPFSTVSLHDIERDPSARRVSHALDEQLSIFYCLIARGGWARSTPDSARFSSDAGAGRGNKGASHSLIGTLLLFPVEKNCAGGALTIYRW
jgi:hypothetical protein